MLRNIRSRVREKESEAELFIQAHKSVNPVGYDFKHNLEAYGDGKQEKKK